MIPIRTRQAAAQAAARILAFTLLLAIPLVACAQEVRATVNGRIQDVSSAAIPDATVIARNIDLGTVTTVKSSGDGNYTIPFLAPGRYTITADAPGFKTAQQSNVVLHVGDKLTVDLGLPVGAVSEVVTVSAHATG